MRLARTTLLSSSNRRPAPELSLAPYLLAALVLLVASSSEAGEARDLQFEPKVVLYGEQEGDAFGTGLATGDFDGDGLEDLAVGAPSAFGAQGSPAAGRVFLYYGSRSIAIPSEEAPAPDAILIGGRKGEQIGLRLRAGDLDGDGRADLVIGTMQGSGPEGSRPSAGEALVLFGRKREELPSRIDLTAFPADITIHGAARNDRLAVEMAMGDFDGDGRTDLALGAMYGDGPKEDRYHAGEVSILFGDDRERLPRVIDLAEAKLPTIYGQEPEDTFGRAIAAGDIDGDHRDDLIVGAYYGDGPENDRVDAGDTFIIFGDRRDLFPVALDLAVDPPLVLTGERDHDTSGRSVASADLDGDGYADVVIGAHQAAADPVFGPIDYRGALYVLFGKPRGAWGRRIDLGKGADLRLLGRSGNDHLGLPVGSGRWGAKGGCVLAFARGSAGGAVGRPGAGEGFVLADVTRPGAAGSGFIDRAALFSLVGPDEGDRIAEDACVLDWNADDRLECALGVPDADGPRNQAPRTGEVVIWSIR